MPDSPDIKRPRAADLAAKLIKAQSRQSVKHLVAAELGNEGSSQESGYAKQDDLAATSFPDRRVGAWIAQEIRPKAGKTRVALVGESVARGFLYDPHFNV